MPREIISGLFSLCPHCQESGNFAGQSGPSSKVPECRYYGNKAQFNRACHLGFKMLLDETLD
jgi:uncharacterized protein (DUF983 family)